MKSGTFKKAVSFFALASVFTLAGCQKDEILEETAVAPIEPTSSTSTIEGKYVVVFKDGSPSTRNKVLGRNGIESGRVKDFITGASDGFSGTLSPSELASLKADENVAFIEPEQAVLLGRAKSSKTTTTNTTTAPTTTETTSTTSTQTIPWGVSRVGYGDGTGKTVWVIDSGVDSKHPDLNVDITRSKSFISGDASFEDGYGHGTGVAGIIGAKNNNIGVVGVAANATIVALRVFDNTGYGTLTRIYSALNHAYQNGKAGDVINMSLRVNASNMLDDLVRKAAAKGMFVVVAAGNSYIDCKNDSPARVVATNVFVVSNMDVNGTFSKSSNYGQSVRFAAPGTNIKTTWKSGGYNSGNGTSFAAPHVAGILALTGGSVSNQGFVVGDPDGNPDPIALK